MPWQTNFTNRLTQNRARFGITSTNRSGGSLTDAVIKRAIADPAWGRTYLQRRGLEDEDIDRILKNESDPGFLAKAFGWMDVLDAPVRALTINRMRAEIEDRRNDAHIGETALRNLGNSLNPLQLVKGTLWDRPETVLNPFEEAGKALRGEQAASFTGLIEDLSDEKFLSQGERDLYGNEVFQFVAGTGMDIAGSPTTYGSSGLTSATKAARAQKVAELVEGGVNTAKMVDLGMDAADFARRYGDEFAQGQRAFGSKADDVLDLTKRLEKGVSYTELPQAARNELFDASTRWAMNSVGGTQRKLGIPFTREVLDEAGQATGKYAAGGFKPAFEKVTKDAAGTLFERAGVQPTLRTWGATGAQKTVNLGKHAVDKGGLKLFGVSLLPERTIVNAAGEVITKPGLQMGVIEPLARKAWTGANSIDLYTKAKSLVNRYAEVDAFGDRMFSTYLRVRSGDLDAARQVARQLAVKRGVELGEVLDVKDANRLGARIEDVLPREAMARASELRKAKQDEVRQMDALVKKLGVYGKDDEAVAAKVASIRGAAAGDAAKANAKLEELATLQADAAEEIASGLERLGLPQSTAEALRASAASLRGRQQGLDSALTEVQRAISQAKSDVDKFVNRSAKLRESAKLPVFGGVDTTAQATDEAPLVGIEGLEPHVNRQGRLSVDDTVGPYEWDYNGHIISRMKDGYPAAVDDPDATWLLWDARTGDSIGDFQTASDARAFVDTKAVPQPEPVRQYKPNEWYLAGREGADNPTTLETAEGYYNDYGAWKRRRTGPVGEHESLEEYLRVEKGKVGELVEMSPDEYIYRASYNMTPGWENLRVSSGNIEKYADKMREGEKFPALYIEYSVDETGKVHIAQEGLHRAMAAKAAGFDKVNVVIVSPAKASAADAYSVIGKVAPYEVAAPVAAVERPPATLDEFIEKTYTPTRLKADGDESTTRFIDDIKGWLQSHQVETAYTDAAGVPVDFTEEYMQALGELPGYKTYRTARKGTQKARYEAFADQLRQMGDMYGIPSISQAGDDHATVAAFGDLLRGGGRDVNLKTADDVIAAFGEDAFVDDILERARVAQEAGDMEAAQAWTDFAEEFTRRMETSTFDELAQDPWAAPVAKTAPEPEVVTQTEMPVARKPREQRVSDVRRKLDDAYARGLVRGRREAARTAVGDAWEAAARSRKAEGREASILEKMAALGDDEARARFAYKHVSKLETEIANIRRQAAVQSDRFRRGATEYDRVERTLALIDAKRAKVEDLDAQMKAIFDEADYGRMERILIEEDGYTPERAHELRLIAEGIRDDLEMSQAAKRAVGRGEVDLLTGQGSTGYTPSMGVGEQPFFENMRRAIDEKTGGKLPVFSPEYRARAEVTEDVFGRPYSELTPAGQKHGGGRGGRSIRPKTPDGREYMTKAERIEAGLQTELDVRHTIPSKLQADADLIAKTRFEDSVIGSSGRRMEFDVEEIAERTGQSIEEVERKVVPEGWVRKRIERDSGNYDVIIPEVLDKWVKTYEDVFISSEAANTFARGFDRIQNTLKSMMTVWNPSFHARNMPSNYFLAFAQEMGDPDSWIEGHRAFAAVLAGEGDKVMIHVGDATMSATELVESLRGQVIRGIGGSTDIGQATLRMIDQATPRENLLGELRRTLSPTRVGQAVGDATENAARASVYLAARNKGLTHEAAMLLPDKVLYNYMPENMTAFEREVVKRIIPFYAWLKQNLPQQIENMLKNPGRIGWLGKMRNAAFDATDIDPTLLPEWMRDLGMMPLPAGEGEENLMWNPSQVPWQDLQRLGAGSKELAGMVSPVIKSPFELMANYDFYRQRDIEGYEYEGERAPGYLTLADNLMGGNPLWESLKEKAHMTYHVDDATGEQYLVVPGKLRKAMRDFMPFAENIGRMVGERPAAYDARSKDTFNALAYATGIRLSPMDEDYYSDQQVRRLRSAIGDELQRLRDEGKL